jgi:acyl-CoA dehydrogenase
VRTRAVRDGDEWVINGQKIWTSLADHADYVWLAARTNPDPKAPPHKSISMFIVPTDAPGFSFSPIHALGENNVHATYYDNVRIPAGNLVDREGGGWKLITSQLNHERVALCSVGPLERILTDTLAWAKQTPNGAGGVLMDLPFVRANLARVYAKLDALKLLNWRQAFNIAEDKLGPAEASAIKVYGSELYVECSRLLMEVHGAAGCLHHSSQGAVLRGRLEKFYRMSLVLTFGGGTNEVQRDLIAQFGLHLPAMGRRS